MGSLLVGTNIAKGICIANNIPLIGINHLEAHVAALFIDHQVNLPMLCLLVSGGHTQIILVNGIDDMQIVGTTQDDAAGEAFDKAAKLLNLGYPGGPLIDQYAKQGDPNKYKFPDSQTQGLDFSFSGIKTSLLYFLRDNLKNDNQFINNELPNICASYQHQIVMSLTKRFAKAIEVYKPGSIGLCGGVSANSELREAIDTLGTEKGLQVCIPAFEYCTDNAAMVAMAGYEKFQKNQFTPLNATPFARAHK
jgi:N6-L-threonylcarbamoyladenine synthase